MSLARTVSFSIAAIVFIILLHSFPVMTMQAIGTQTELTLIAAVKALFAQHDELLAALVAISIVIAPIVFSVGLLYVTAPLLIGRALPGAIRINIWIQQTSQWSMLEVFLLGFIVSLLKLGHIAELHFGIGLWALVCLVICIAASMSSMDHLEIWDRLELATMKTEDKSNTRNDLALQDEQNGGEMES